VNASGPNNRPSCASSVKTGMKLSVMISSEKNSAGPTSSAASVMTFQRASPTRLSPGCACCQASSFLCAFSIITTAASTIAPIAIAMPPSDMMFALMPCQRMIRNAAITPSGSAMMATSAERRCHRKIAQTAATTMNSSISFAERLSMARSISALRS